MKKKTDKAKRNRRIAVGAGVGALGLGLLLFLGSNDANAGEMDPDPDPDPEPNPKAGGGGLRGVGQPGGGNSGPGGNLPSPEDDPLGPEKPRRSNPDGGAGGAGGQRSNPGDGGGGGGGGQRSNPTPSGPDPDFDDMPDFYNPDWPDPGKFYQVTSGRDSDGLYGIAWRWWFTSLFFAARNEGGLSEADAQAWAADRVGPKGVAQAERADYILCVAWNDIVYGSNTVAAKNRRGPHGRGIDLVPQHANNWSRIRNAQRVIRNVYMGSAGSVGTPRNAGRGNAKLPLLWMPRLSDAALWNSSGQTIKAAGTWADGSTFYHPPPRIMNLGVNDMTDSASLGVWGCGAGRIDYRQG